MGAVSSDADYQRDVLPRVSRTFALTIPELPTPLDVVVGNAYLLCRIADTVEDDPCLDGRTKRKLHELLPDVIHSPEAAAEFARRAGCALSKQTPAAERDLVANAPRIARTARSFRPADRAAIGACLQEMCRGMELYDGRGDRGLDDLADLDRYCHYVAGVVGEMLTELFCNHDAAIAERRPEMQRLASSFGQGLQMTNILKDVWDDLAEGRCWLPRSELDRVGYDLDRLSPVDARRPVLNQVITELVGIAHGHLRNALSYTLQIPGRHGGIRRFCFWSVGLALLTLRRIHGTPDYASQHAVKVSRKAVGSVVMAVKAAGRSDSALKVLFACWSRGLPLRAVVPPRVAPSPTPNPG
jgi:farnesyl-diphosphate farnesyltransferase